ARPWTWAAPDQMPSPHLAARSHGVATPTGLIREVIEGQALEAVGKWPPSCGGGHRPARSTPTMPTALRECAGIGRARPEPEKSRKLAGNVGFGTSAAGARSHPFGAGRGALSMNGSGHRAPAGGEAQRT